MNTLNRKLAILIMVLSIALPVFAQDETEVPKPTAEVTVEVTAEPLPVVEPEAPLAEPVPVDRMASILEYLSAHTAEILMFIGVIYYISKFKQPITATEKAYETAEIARLKEEARLTQTLIDDVAVMAREIVLGMRRMEEAIPTIATTPTVTVASGTPSTQQTVNVFTEDAPPVTNSPVEVPPIEG